MTDSQGNTTPEVKVEEKQPTAIPTDNKPAESNEPKLPDGVAERTKEQFDKLTEHNAQLKAELDALKSKTSVLDELKPPEIQVETPNLPPGKAEEIKSRFVDENGYVDVVKVEEALKLAESKALEAKRQTEELAKKIQDSEEKVTVKAVHAEFPEVDPHSDKFDVRFYNLVKNELIGQMMNGRQDLAEATLKVDQLLHPEKYEVKKPEVTVEQKEKITKRNQASENVEAVSSKGEPTDMDELVRRTRAGDDNALYKRLQKSGN